MRHIGAFTRTAAATLAVAASAAPVFAASGKFFLKPNDRVVFYGDSITEQRFYPVDIEAFVRTRFPNLRVKFVDSGVGGDRVEGGWAGPIDLRLKRDVFPYKPNVVTIMLGMNDAGYGKFNPALFAQYEKGYRHIIKSLQAHLPGVKIILIGPSPFDDVTQPPQFAGGYNAVLQRYDKFVQQLAKQKKLGFVDFNAPLVKVLQQAKKLNPAVAGQIIPGRVHPSAAGQLVMAAALLKAWHAPATVARVTLQSQPRKDTYKVVQADGAKIHDINENAGSLSWNEKDKSLPAPILGLHVDWPLFPPDGLWPAPASNPGYTVAATAMAAKLCHFYPRLDAEMLVVKGLNAATYTLAIDGQNVGTFTKKQLATGINLAKYSTPMMTQAENVLALVWKAEAVRFYAWRHIQLKLNAKGNPWFPGSAKGPSKRLRKAVHALLAALALEHHRIVAQTYAAAKPRLHKFKLTAVK